MKLLPKRIFDSVGPSRLENLAIRLVTSFEFINSKSLWFSVLFAEPLQISINCNRAPTSIFHNNTLLINFVRTHYPSFLLYEV